MGEEEGPSGLGGSSLSQALQSFRRALEGLLSVGGGQALAGAIFQEQATKSPPGLLLICLGPTEPESWVSFQADFLLPCRLPF